jgi:hypothetical protein
MQLLHCQVLESTAVKVAAHLPNGATPRPKRATLITLIDEELFSFQSSTEIVFQQKS